MVQKDKSIIPFVRSFVRSFGVKLGFFFKNENFLNWGTAALKNCVNFFF